MCRSAARTDEGQALIVLVALLGLGALVAISLSDATGQVVAGLRAERAAEAAAEAAGAVVADRLLEIEHEASGAGSDAVGAVVDDVALMNLARAAAAEVAARLEADIQDLKIERLIDEVAVRVEIQRGGVRARARVGVRPP
jgi:hypothetical protein